MRWMNDGSRDFYHYPAGSRMRIRVCCSLSADMALQMTSELRRIFAAKRADCTEYFTRFCGGRNCFIKVTPVRSFKQRLRVLFGISRSNGRKEWPVAEIQNHIVVSERIDFVPEFFAYGLMFSGLLPDRVFIITRAVDNTMTLYEYIQNNLSRKAEIFREALRLVSSLYAEGVFHADLHSSNIIVNSCTGEMQVVDFANCFIGLSPDLCKNLSLTAGLLFRFQLKDFFDEAEYDHLILTWLSEESLHNHWEPEVYNVAKTRHVSRCRSQLMVFGASGVTNPCR